MRVEEAAWQMTKFANSRQARAALLNSQSRVFERIASGAPLAETLTTLVRLIEEQTQGMRCAVLLAVPGQQRLRFVAAPSIPEDYKAGIEPFLRIAPGMGSCGTAAFLREPVYTRDTASDILWKACGDIAVRNKLRAIWAAPILAGDTVVLGAFAMYCSEPRAPSAEDIQLIGMATQMALVAIQRQQDIERLEAHARRYSTNAGLAGGVRDAGALEPLSPQEEKVLALVADGKTNKETAAVLGLSDKTVKNYLSRIFAKLQVNRRAAAAVLYRRIRSPGRQD
jgi:DNA-binding CsgD family transcriptional regulator